MNQTHYKYWPKRLPKSFAYPQTPLHDFLETTARRYPDHPGIIYYGRRISFSELWTECLCLAGALAGLGTTTGDRVALYMLINAAGFKVWSAEIESVLYRHPAVLEVCVIGVTDAERVEDVKALVVLKPKAIGKVTADDIIEWSKGQMSAYKHPRVIEIVESLPGTGTGCRR
jgi:acyl-CoA synthetase (AMP-forming)/AMP-acid ligase II